MHEQGRVAQHHVPPQHLHSRLQSQLQSRQQSHVHPHTQRPHAHPQLLPVLGGGDAAEDDADAGGEPGNAAPGLDDTSMHDELGDGLQELNEWLPEDGAPGAKSAIAKDDGGDDDLSDIDDSSIAPVGRATTSYREDGEDDETRGGADAANDLSADSQLGGGRRAAKLAAWIDSASYGRFIGITTFFNPGRHQNKVDNFRKFRASVAAQGLQLLCVELVFGETTPFQLRGTSPIRPEEPEEVQQGAKDGRMTPAWSASAAAASAMEASSPIEVAADCEILVQQRTAASNTLWQKERLLNIALDNLPHTVDKVRAFVPQPSAPKLGHICHGALTTWQRRMC